MPSRALLRPAEALAEARRVPGVVEATDGDIDVGAALPRRDEVIHDGVDDGRLPWLEENGIALIRGPWRIAGERRVRVGDHLYEARDAVVLAVGSAAAMAPIPGLAEAAPQTSTSGSRPRLRQLL